MKERPSTFCRLSSFQRVPHPSLDSESNQFQKQSTMNICMPQSAKEDGRPTSNHLALSELKSERLLSLHVGVKALSLDTPLIQPSCVANLNWIARRKALQCWEQMTNTAHWMIMRHKARKRRRNRTAPSPSTSSCETRESKFEAAALAKATSLVKLVKSSWVSNLRDQLSIFSS